MFIDDIEGVRSKRLFRGINKLPKQEANKFLEKVHPRAIHTNLNHIPVKQNRALDIYNGNKEDYTNLSSIFSSNANPYSQINFQVSSRRSRINEDSGMQHYYNTSNIMNYKGDSLDVTDIEGAGAGSFMDPILKHRKMPLNPLNPDYEFPGDVELKGTQSRRQYHSLERDANDQNREEIISRSKSQRRLLQSIRNARKIDEMINRIPSVVPEEEFSYFNTRHKSVNVPDKLNDSFNPRTQRNINYDNNQNYRMLSNNLYEHDMNDFISKRKNEIRMSEK